MPQTVIPLRKHYGRTVRTADSEFWFACYLYSIDGVPPSLTHVHSTPFSSQQEKHPEIDIHPYRYRYRYIIFALSLILGSQKKKVRRGKIYTDCPKKIEMGRKCGERRKKRGRSNEIMKVHNLVQYIHIVGAQSLLVHSPFLVFPLAGFLKSCLRTVLYCLPLCPLK